MKNEPRKIRRQRLQNLKCVRLQVEKLECRRLLAGLNVSVTIDTSLAVNLTAETDTPAANRIVYVDLNRNGVAEATEPVAITDEAGHAFFEGLEAGDYSIGLLTDNYHQRQISPAVVEQTSKQSVPLPSRWLIGGTEEGQSLWGLSTDGILSFVSGNNKNEEGLNTSIIEIGGQPVSILQRTPAEAWISYRTASQSKLAIFDSVTKQLSSYYVSGSENLVDLASDGQSVFGVLKGGGQADVIKLELNSSSLVMTEIASGQFSELELLGNQLVVVRQSDTAKFLELLDLTGKRLSSTSIPSSASQLEVDAFTASVVVVSTDGVVAYRVSENELTKVALIAEAAAPIAMSSGRMLATDRSRSGDLTLWSMADWTPVGQLHVGEVDIRDIRSTKLEALVLTDEFVHSLDLAVARPYLVALGGEEVEEIRFSVQEIAPGASPEVEAPSIRSIVENQSEQLDLRQLVTDANGHTLWFSVITNPLHGTIQLSPVGQLEFTPEADFYGTDSVTIRVHDGLASADVAINWQIIEANRPPIALEASIDEMPEGLPAGSAIGTVTVIDQNHSDSYEITSADPRFRIENGNIILNEPLDFEAGSSIVLDLTAIDVVGQFSISASTTVRLTNVVEAPEGVVLAELSIPENIGPVAVGKLYVIAPDATGSYQTSVNDSRFEVRGDELWLLEPLNYEEVSEIELLFTTKDIVHPDFIVDSPSTLTVTNQDDKPSAIKLNSSEVPEQTPGAEVGLIAVEDEDGDVYQFQVSDGRFVVADGILRLNESATLDRSEESSIPITVTASTAGGGIIIFTFPLTVVPPLSPWQNPSNPNDVNDDGIISASDALHVINFLNENGPGQTPESEPGGSGEDPVFPDVNGDGRISPIDALIIINELNDNASGSGESGGGGNRLNGEGEGQIAGTSAPPHLLAWNEDEERRKNNSRIDAELEDLLDQLANDTI